MGCAMGAAARPCLGTSVCFVPALRAPRHTQGCLVAGGRLCNRIRVPLARSWRHRATAPGDQSLCRLSEAVRPHGAEQNAEREDGCPGASTPRSAHGVARRPCCFREQSIMGKIKAFIRTKQSLGRRGGHVLRSACLLGAVSGSCSPRRPAFTVLSSPLPQLCKFPLFLFRRTSRSPSPGPDAHVAEPGRRFAQG